IYFYEVGGMSAIGGVIPRPVKGKMGILDPEDIEREIRQPNIHFPQTSLICIENTHNRAGGTIFPPEQIEDMHEVAKRHNLRLYMDGARIFNAAVALEVDVKAFTKHVDNLMFCLSKGLGAPIGSIVVGDSDFVERARKFRKMLGGGMRQAGVIASPGIIALEKMVDRLKEDHYNARILAEGLSKIEGISIDPRAVQTNIVALDIGGLGISSEKFIGVIKEGGVKVNALDSKRVRMVTHIGITTDDIKYALSVIEEISKKQKQRLS
ncbi:MAG: Threonine aldolase, partial [Euryarchaeota archaeon]|nr:Threonine aldolase [Euryarchaeota archaeon]